jgi:hypothetical protein
MLHAVMKLMERWEAISQARLDLFSGPPDNYIPGLTLEIISGRPASKLEALFNPENTPFMYICYLLFFMVNLNKTVFCLELIF